MSRGAFDIGPGRSSGVWLVTSAAAWAGSRSGLEAGRPWTETSSGEGEGAEGVSQNMDITHPTIHHGCGRDRRQWHSCGYLLWDLPLDTATADVDGSARIMERSGKASSARLAAEREMAWSSCLLRRRGRFGMGMGSRGEKQGAPRGGRVVEGRTGGTQRSECRAAEHRSPRWVMMTRQGRQWKPVTHSRYACCGPSFAGLLTPCLPRTARRRLSYTSTTGTGMTRNDIRQIG